MSLSFSSKAFFFLILVFSLSTIADLPPSGKGAPASYPNAFLNSSSSNCLASSSCSITRSSLPNFIILKASFSINCCCPSLNSLNAPSLSSCVKSVFLESSNALSINATILIDSSEAFAFSPAFTILLLRDASTFSVFSVRKEYSVSFFLTFLIRLPPPTEPPPMIAPSNIDSCPSLLVNVFCKPYPIESISPSKP